MHVYKRGKRWWCRFQVDGVEHRRSCKTTTHKDAIKEATRLHNRALAGQPLADETPQGPPAVAACLDAYLEELRRRGSSPGHIRRSRHYIGQAIIDAEAKTMADLDTPALERALAALADRSPATRNHALSYVRAWFRWLCRTRRWTDNAAAPLERIRGESRRRLAFTDEELEAITEDARIPRCRRLVYRVAADTGLRRAELGALVWEDVGLDAPEVTIRGEHAKNGRTVTIPIQESTAAAWRAWAEKPTERRAFDEVPCAGPLPAVPTVRTFYQDLVTLGILEADAEGKPIQRAAGRLDFHALRVTYCSLLARAGVSLTMAQELMRHSDPKLTANLYTSFAPRDRRAAVELLTRHKNRIIADAEDVNPAQKLA